MPIIGHLEELRNRIIVLIAFFVILFGVFYAFRDKVFLIITKPLPDKELVFLDITEPFFVNLRLAFLPAVIAVMPLIIFQIIAFLFPAFNKKTKKRVLVTAVSFFILFYGGIAFSYYFLIPTAVQWFISQSAGLTQTLSASQYIGFMGWFLIGTGLLFEMPLVLLLLIRLDILKVEQLRKKWRIVYIVLLLICAIVTDASPITMLILAGPMIILYEMTLLIGKILFKRKKG